jgi:hypothetical protein
LILHLFPLFRHQYYNFIESISFAKLQARPPSPNGRFDGASQVQSKEQVHPTISKRVPSTTTKQNGTRQMLNFAIASGAPDDEEWVLTESGADNGEKVSEIVFRIRIGFLNIINQICYMCLKGGQIIICDLCDQALCGKCVELPNEIPSGSQFLCPACHIEKFKAGLPYYVIPSIFRLY